MTHTPPKTDEEWANLMVVRYAQFAKLSAEEGTNDGSLHSDEITNINIEIIHQIRTAERLATIEECAKVCENDLPIFQEMRGVASIDPIVLERNEAVRNACDAVRKGLAGDIRALTNQPHGNATGGGNEA
jgi:hypothetical protein